jgi:hypothetical protein
MEIVAVQRGRSGTIRARQKRVTPATRFRRKQSSDDLIELRRPIGIEHYRSGSRPDLAEIKSDWEGPAGLRAALAISRLKLVLWWSGPRYPRSAVADTLTVDTPKITSKFSWESADKGKGSAPWSALIFLVKLLS